MLERLLGGNTYKKIIEDSVRNHLVGLGSNVEEEFLFDLGVLVNKNTESRFGSLNHNFTQDEKA